MSVGTLEAFFSLQWWTTRDFIELWIYWGIIESFEYSAEGCSSRDSIEWISQFNKYSENERDFLENTRNLPDTRTKSWKVEMNIFSGYRITYSRSEFFNIHREWQEFSSVERIAPRMIRKICFNCFEFWNSSCDEVESENENEIFIGVFFYLNNISATLPVELRKTNSEYFLCFQFSRRSKHIFVGRYVFFGGVARRLSFYFLAANKPAMCIERVQTSPDSLCDFLPN